MIMVSLIYLVVTMSIMLLMVYLGRKGLDRVQWHFLEHNESLITGAILVLLGIFVYFVEL